MSFIFRNLLLVHYPTVSNRQHHWPHCAWAIALAQKKLGQYNWGGGQTIKRGGGGSAYGCPEVELPLSGAGLRVLLKGSHSCFLIYGGPYVCMVRYNIIIILPKATNFIDAFC